MKNTITLALLASIFLTSNTFAQKTPKLTDEEKIKKFVVVALLGSVENRRTLEEEITIDLSLSGIKAIPSYRTNLTTSDKVTKEQAIKVCENNDADGIILVQVLSSSQSTGYSSRVYQQYGTYFYWGVFAFYYGPGWELVDSENATLRTDIIKIPDGQLVYYENTSITVGSDVEPIIGRFSEKLTKKIIKKSLAKVNQ